MDLDGHIVEFLESGGLRFGYVRKREQRKIRVIDRRGRQSSVPVSRVVVVHTAIPEEDFSAVAEAIGERVAAIAADIDVELLWESTQEEVRERDSAEFAESYFNGASAESASAMFRVLAANGLFFKRNGARFLPRSRRQLDAERLRLTREQEKNLVRREVSRVLNQAIDEGPPLEDPAWQTVSEHLETWLRRREPNEAGTLLEQLVGEARARETAYDLLLQSNRIETSEDRFLVIHGISPAFPDEVLETARHLVPFENNATRETRSGVTTLAIDDEDTVEVDDALTVYQDGSHTVVGIHIADVSAFVAKNDILDQEAYKRSATIYLPNVSVPMFPGRLSTNLASLVSGIVRPVFSVEARFDARDELIAFEVLRAAVTVTERLSYDSADRRLGEGDPELVLLHRIACRLHERRSEHGAQTHHRPEIKLRVIDGEVSVRKIEVDTPSRFVVSEMMILANRLTADRAAARGIPIIFRTQEPPDAPPPETKGVPEAIQFELLRRGFKRSRLSLSPGAHSGLGLGAYTQMSSPIRRYGDLVTQRQFVAALEKTPFPYDREELLTIIISAESAELEIRRLEQASTTYWVLLYLSRKMLDTPLSALVVDQKRTVELTDYLVRGKVADKVEWRMGDTVEVKIEAIDPIRGDIRFRTCS